MRDQAWFDGERNAEIGGDEQKRSSPPGPLQRVFEDLFFRVKRDGAGAHITNYEATMSTALVPED